jgi:hypothetical protein
LTLALVAGAAVGQGTPTTGTPGDGTLAVADLVRELHALGLDVEETGQIVEHPFFTAPAHLLTVEGADLQVLVYADSAARERDSSQISDDGSGIGSTDVDWIAPPHFTEAGNLLVLLLTDDADLAVDVESAVRALDARGTPIASPRASPGSGTPTAGILTVADLVAALRAGGLAVEETDQRIEQTFFVVPAEILRVEGVDLQVFVYPSVAARAADSDQISPDGSTIGTTMVTWLAPPHFASAGNVLTLLLTDDDALAARVEDVVAGLDQG